MNFNQGLTALFDWEGPLPQESIEEYHARPGYLSSTDIKYMEKSPAHFKTYALDRIFTKSSRALDFGDYAHRINLLNDHDFFVVDPDFRPIEEMYIGKDGKEKSKVIKTIKAQYEEFEAANPGKVILTQKEHDDLYFMHDVFKKNTALQEHMVGCDPEVGFLYWDDLHGRRCKFRADLINTKNGLILDYKTTSGASEYEFSKSIARYGYHVSAAHYKLGAERIFSRDFRFILVAQEKTPPYAIGLYELRKSSMDRAITLRSKYLMKINECSESGNWPDYSYEGVRKIEVPEYAFGD